MRSNVYSFFTTILLLIPIAALPLMAVFGVPQFTPVVVSPMDEPAEDEEGRTARPRRRERYRPIKTEEPDFEIVEDDTLSWDEAPPKPSRLDRKLKSRDRAEPRRTASTQSLADADFESSRSHSRSSSAPKRRLAANDSWDSGNDAEGETLQTNFEEAAVEDTRPRRKHAEEPREIEALADESTVSFAETPESTPGFRRQQPAAAISEATAAREQPSASRNPAKAPSREAPTWAGAVRRLNELGIRNFRLEPGSRPSEFVFSCSVTPGNSPRVTRMFEAEADDPLKAVAKVLTQVEEWAAQQVTTATRDLSEDAAALEPEE